MGKFSQSPDADPWARQCLSQTCLRKLILLRRPWLLLLPFASAQFVAPPPVRDLAATDITANSITLTFSEDNYFKTEVICQPEGTLINPGSNGNRTFTGLEPGKLYSFLATTVDPNSPDRRSEPVSLNQDSVWNLRVKKRLFL